MIAQNFEYSRPASLDEALKLVEGGAKVLAGGMSLIPMMKLRLAAPEHLVDLRRVPGLSGIAEQGGRIRIGSMTTHYQVESSAFLKSKCPLLAETAGWIGDVQIRNTGTIGGSVAHADPSSDYPAALLALEATVHLVSRTGRRLVAYSDFLVDTFTTQIEAGEIVEAIEVPVEDSGTGVNYQKMVQPASGFAIVGVAARIARAGGKVTKAHVGVTGVGAKAYRAGGVEAALLAGASPQAAAKGTAEGVDANSDIHASARYRTQMAQVFAARAIAAALSRAK